jgi:hypothetical protein
MPWAARYVKNGLETDNQTIGHEFGAQKAAHATKRPAKSGHGPFATCNALHLASEGPQVFGPCNNVQVFGAQPNAPNNVVAPWPCMPLVIAIIFCWGRRSLEATNCADVLKRPPTSMTPRNCSCIWAGRVRGTKSGSFFGHLLV